MQDSGRGRAAARGGGENESDAPLFRLPQSNTRHVLLFCFLRACCSTLGCGRARAAPRGHGRTRAALCFLLLASDSGKDAWIRVLADMGRIRARRLFVKNLDDSARENADRGRSRVGPRGQLPPRSIDLLRCRSGSVRDFLFAPSGTPSLMPQAESRQPPVRVFESRALKCFDSVPVAFRSTIAQRNRISCPSQDTPGQLPGVLERYFALRVPEGHALVDLSESQIAASDFLYAMKQRTNHTAGGQCAISLIGRPKRFQVGIVV